MTAKELKQQMRSEALKNIKSGLTYLRHYGDARRTNSDRNSYCATCGKIWMAERLDLIDMDEAGRLIELAANAISHNNVPDGKHQ